MSGIFWVPGATAGIYGIQNAGLAVSVGTWSSIMVISSFCWGILIFQESVNNKFQAFLASIILVLGLIGMSFYSVPADKKNKISRTPPVEVHDDEFLDGYTEETTLDSSSTQLLMSDDDTAFGGRGGFDHGALHDSAEGSPLRFENRQILGSEEGIVDGALVEINSEIVGEEQHLPQDVNVMTPRKSTFDDETSDEDLVRICGCFVFTKRQLGLIGAIFNGVWGSNSMIPMHYARLVNLASALLHYLSNISHIRGRPHSPYIYHHRAQGIYGAGYLISYSIGSMVITLALWILRYLVNLYYSKGDFKKAWNAIPSFHFRILFGPGSMAGLLYSLGNFSKIIAITQLGQGVGYSFVQTSLLVSGIWGIFYFGEVKGSERIFKWLLSSLVTLIGILSLSYEHKSISD